jgi:phosphatidylserine/phosphatidylglycerophosphate/cardiolipin synthase-like enzyme
MHNKFAVMDAGDMNNAMVWTGSTNWSDDQLNEDANNVVIINDQSLAIAYKMEFEEMWGSNGPLPLPGNAKFGPDKSDNTPHEFSVGGKRVECYFSPSDNTNRKILESLSSANSELYAALLIFTRIDLANEMAAKINSGVYSAVMVDDSTGSSNSWNILKPLLGNNMMQFDHLGLAGILHHKYAIVDQSNAGSDPLVITGSHNWSTTADSRNDENTVVIHDADIANQYFQEFVKRFNDQGNPLGVQILQPGFNNNHLLIYPNPANESLVMEHWSLSESNYSLKIIDVTGRIISEKILYQKKGYNRERISLLQLDQGIYHGILENGSIRKDADFSVIR